MEIEEESIQADNVESSYFDDIFDIFDSITGNC